ncbi:DUF642 domain-containing protein [Bradyrhizobium lablabi]|uniref:DUF642 domain-containing protein n=1 Tax=Bradyrhizobium lablabi TaxID=722472 RepID=UPI001BA74C91|nr:DUF642 domain-containing protein [Bradyrhizobium lablabi]MBR0697807.1 DUF642 domain-containing protein [Bradyrhizobium lablabi]
MKTMKPIILAAAFSMVAGAAGAATIVDGDFAGAGSPYQTIGAGQTFGANNAWTVVSGSIDWIGNYWQSPGSGGSVDLDGNSVGAISQTLQNLAAGTYTVTFALSGNPDGQPPTKGLQVGVAGTTQTYSYPLAGTRNDMKYVTESFTFTWLGGDAVLTFASLDDPSSNPYGPVIGDVAISAVPEPSTWAMMILGFASVGYLAHRRRAVAPAA